jgi:hypothetical protein
VRDQVDALSVDDYFNYLARLMKTNPPSPDDAPIVAKMATIGLIPGKDFDPSKLGGFDREAIKAVPKLAQVKIMEHFKQFGEPVNGWRFSTKVGTYGTDYIQRALVTAVGLGANRPQDAIYPVADKAFFVPNPLNRYTLSQRNKFITNADGSVDLYLQADSPGKAKEANWLPAPKANFVPMLRLYWPKETPPSIIDGTWKPPAITVAQGS